MAAAAAPGASASIATVSAQTVTRLAADIVQNVKAKTSHFQLALDPAGLGRVDINVRIGADGALSATLNFNSPQAADALKANAGELRDALQQAGFNLSGSDLSFTAGGSHQQSGQGQGQSHSFTGAAFASATPELQAPPASAIQAASAPADGLDIRI
ncbi:MAG TPA: flagellar hook-length control protein FliK [Caulobacteraceae bacterium]